MRSEEEMLDLILTTAHQDDRIRAVLLEGSRSNPNAPRDFFQDFDIVYVVTDLESIKNDIHWIERFGEMMILQLPDDMGVDTWKPGSPYGYLMQFIDGNRIDLTLFPLEKVEEVYGANGSRDSLSTTLLDKDGVIPPFPPASDKDHLPKPPTAKEFFDCCNEFWWINPYAAKGLWREELVYAKWMLDVYMREQLMHMLDWYVGVRTEFSVSTGKYGKYLQRCMEPELWQMLQQTYSGASYEETWAALEAMCALFRRTAVPVARHFGFEYLHGEDQRVSAHLEHVRRLPKDAKTMY